MLFWETGAVGMLGPESDPGGLTFRVPPTGGVLGSAAIDYVADRIAPEVAERRRPALRRDLRRRRVRTQRRRWCVRRDRAPRPHRRRALRLRRPDGGHARARARRWRPPSPTSCSSRPTSTMRSRCDASSCASTCPWWRTSERPPAIACRRSARPWARTRSASTPPTSRPPTTIDPSGLLPGGRGAAASGRTTRYRERWDEDMSPAALAGFSAAWALFTDVLPRADLDVGCRCR